MPDDDQNDWTLLTRYVAGECTSAEVAEVERRLAADPALQEELGGLRRLWDRAGSLPSGSRVDAMWRDLTERMGGAKPAAPVPRPGLRVVPNQVTPRTRRVRIAAGLAAAVALTVAGGLVWRHLVPDSAPVVARTLPFREVRTPAGQRAEFRLADGTRVALGPASVLRYDTTTFGLSTRELHLEGRAYFEVTHDSRRPFLVHTAHTVTEDLGTEFVITDYVADSAAEVVVATGTVAVRRPSADSARPAAILKRGELIRVEADGQGSLRRDVDLTAALAWIEGRLVFVDTPLAEAVAQLNRWHGLDVRIGHPSLAKHRFTASYTGESPVAIVRELAAAVGARPVRRGAATVLVPLTTPAQGS